MREPLPPASHSLLGTRVTPMTAPQFFALVREAVTARRRRVIANHNLHSVYLFHHDARMRAFYALADAVFIDGMSLVAWGALLGLPLRRDHRLTSVDWITPLLAEAAGRRWRVFYLGGRPGVAERGADALRARFPSLTIATAPGYFDATPGSADNRRLVAVVNAWQPDVLLVGMGMPRQEHWLLDHHAQLNATVLLPVGACFDYLAGTTPTPPRALSRWGLEWLFRLAHDPRRLWRRYLVEPWLLLGLMAADLRRQRG